MAALVRHTTFIVTAIIFTFSTFGRTSEEKTQQVRDITVFNKSPVGTQYSIWWRPYLVVPDESKVKSIQKQLEAIKPDKAQSIDLDKAFGKNIDSSFLLLMLALSDEKGTIILERFLKEYSPKKKLDNRWLLIIASLGRAKNQKAKDILWAELERLNKEYKFPEKIKMHGHEFEGPDLRIAVIDALLACEASLGTLTAEKIKVLQKKMPDSFVIPLAAMEWAQLLMDESSLEKTIEDCLKKCDENDLKKAINHEVSSAFVGGIGRFLANTKDIWPLTQKITFEKVSRSKAISDYLRTTLCSILLFKAQLNKGEYPMDEKFADAFLAKKDIESRRLSSTCKILSGCKASEKILKWEEFVNKQAQKIDKRDLPIANSILRRIVDPKPGDPEFPSMEKSKIYSEMFQRYENIKEYGVFMRGLEEVEIPPELLKLKKNPLRKE